MNRDLIIEKQDTGWLEGKTVLIGFPGMAFVGKMTAEVLIEKLGLKETIEVLPVEAPGTVMVSNGILEAPSIKIFASKESPIVVLTGGFQPQSDEAQQKLAHKLLSLLAENKIKRIIAAAAFVVPEASDPRKVYVTATNENLLETLEKHSCVRMDGGISGLNGLIPALSKAYGIEGAVILGETSEMFVAGGIVDYKAVAEVIRVVSLVIGLDVTVNDVLEKAREIEEKIERAIKIETGQTETVFRKREDEPSTHM